jgi:hypothetical protein
VKIDTRGTPPALTTMQINYSRDYLRGIPEKLRQERKKQMIQTLLNNIVGGVTAAATNEKTSYMVEDRLYLSYYSQIHQAPIGRITLTNEEIIGALQEKFPDCIISFQETWADTAHNTRTLQKGILIDWS